MSYTFFLSSFPCLVFDKQMIRHGEGWPYFQETMAVLLDAAHKMLPPILHPRPYRPVNSHMHFVWRAATSPVCVFESDVYIDPCAHDCTSDGERININFFASPAAGLLAKEDALIISHCR